MNKELVDYIKQQTEINVSKNEITDILLQQGWHQSEIDEAFAQAVADFGSAGQSGLNVESPALNGQNQGNGNGKKALLFIVPVAAVLLLAAGAMMLLQKPQNPQNGQTTPPVAENNFVDEADVANEPVTEESGNENQAKPELLAEIAKLEQSITPPPGWASRQGIMSQRPLAVFFKPEWEKDAAGKNIFNENVNVVRDALSSNLDDYLDKAKAALKANVGDYKIISDRKVSLKDGTQATLIGGSFTQNDMAMKNMQLYAAKGSNIYIITGVTLASNWDAEKDVIGEAVMSFVFPEN